MTHGGADAKPSPAGGRAPTEPRQRSERKSGALAGAFTEVVKDSAVIALKELDQLADDWYVGVNGIAAGPLRLGELRSKAAVGAVTGDSLVWRDGLAQWQPLRSFPELVAIVEEAASSAHASFAPPPPIDPAAAALVSVAPRAAIHGLESIPDPFAGGQPAAVPRSVGEDPEEIAGLPRRRQSPAAWLAVAVALLLGLTIGFVAFGGTTKPQTIVKYVEVPVSGAPVAPAPLGESPPAPLAASSTLAVPRSGAGASPRQGGSALVTARAPDGKGISGLGELGGLAAGPGGPSREEAPSSAGQPLDPTQVQRTVSRYTGGVKRSCWQPALDSRAEDAPSTARVTVSIRVSPSGSVETVSSSGDPKGYQGLASCIATRVRAWQFPASSGTTTVNVPFVFAAQ